MPYGCIGFRCESCGEELLTYRRYCWCCGAKQPEMKEVSSFSCESDLHIINTKLKRTRGWKAQLWSYRVSNSELEIRLQRPGENLMLMCIATSQFLHQLIGLLPLSSIKKKTKYTMTRIL